MTRYNKTGDSLVLFQHSRRQPGRVQHISEIDIRIQDTNMPGQSPRKNRHGIGTHGPDSTEIQQGILVGSAAILAADVSAEITLLLA